MSEDITLVREGGVEPPHPFGHTDLNRARLPIPPLARIPLGKRRNATCQAILLLRSTVAEQI